MLTTWTLLLAAVPAFTLTDPPAAAERALLGRTTAREVGSSNLRIAPPENQVSPGRALLGELTDDEGGTAGEAIRIRSRRADGPGALLGQS